MSKQVRSLTSIWVIVALVAIGSILYINHTVNAMVRNMVGVETNYPADKSELRVTNISPSNVQPQLQAIGSSSIIQPASSQSALTSRSITVKDNAATLDWAKALASGGLEVK